MEKILLAVIDDINNKGKFEQILGKLEDIGYQINIFSGVTIESFDIEILHHLVNDIKSKKNEEAEIILLSNIRDVVVLWYRCYNKLIDHFIYFIDGKGNFFVESEDVLNGFMYSMARFEGMDDEFLEGKIFIDIDQDNFELDYDFFEENINCFNHIDNLKDIETKQKVNKIYKFKGYNFEFSFSDDTKNVKYVDISKKTYERKSEYIDEIFNYDWFTPYIVIRKFKNGSIELINSITIYASCVDVSKKTHVFNVIPRFINSSEEFELKLSLVALLASMKYKKDELLKLVMNILLNSDGLFSLKYAFLIQTYFYRSNFWGLVYDGYYKDVRNILSEMTSEMKMLNKMRVINKSDNNNIAIIVDQLIDTSHSPTKYILDYVKSINMKFPGYKVKVFVEDNFFCEELENITNYFFSSVNSKDCITNHYNYLGIKDVDIFYADNSLYRKDKILNMVNNIIEFKPNVILSTSDVSLSNMILSEYIPSVFMSMGGEYFVACADYYLCGNKSDVAKVNGKYKLFSNHDVIDFNYGMTLDKSNEILDLDKYNVLAEDFVMVSVGNRISSELTQEYIDGVCNFIINNDKVKWLIVGAAYSKEIEDFYPKLVKEERIIFISYEKQLSSLYNSCDVYINPRRYSGGVSVAMAMKQGLPIATLSEISDALYYVGEENACGKTMGEYLNYLEKLYQDKEYRNIMSNRMIERIESMSVEKSVESLMDILKNAVKKAESRI